ncbi:MAG TPA: hypothetical protein VFJ43_06390, partial [Bacteroidia bacterium]|nr:hypothetical protein [Bacteroidia bacterium]
MKKRIEKHHDLVFLFGTKKIPVCFIYAVVFSIAFIPPVFSFAAPIGKVDSLMAVLQRTKTDTARARMMVYIADALHGAQPDKAIAMADSALQLTREKGPDDIHAHAASIIGNVYNGKGMYQLA